MALFSRQPNSGKSTESVKPAKPLISPTAATAEGVNYEEVHLPSHTLGPAAARADSRSYLDKGSKISGKLFFEGPVRIDGQVEGEISANQVVVIGESALVTAPLKAASVVIGGRISGDIIASKRVEMCPTAKVLGNLTVPTLVVHDGALFEGYCAMNPEVKEDRKVTPLASKEEHVIPQAAAGGKKLR